MKWEMIAETNPHKTKLALQTSQEPGVMVKSLGHQEQNGAAGPTSPPV